MGLDAQDVFEACQDPEIQHRTTVPVPYLHRHAVEFVTSTASRQWDSRTGALFCVASGEDDRVLGSCGLVAVDWARAIAEVGYWIVPAVRGDRLAERAVRILAAWALDAGGMRRLELHIEPDNLASRAVAEGAGCLSEGTIERTADGRLAEVEHVLYALTG